MAAWTISWDTHTAAAVVDMPIDVFSFASADPRESFRLLASRVRERRHTEVSFDAG